MANGMSWPLRGVRVLSLAQQLPGPYCGMLLGDLGADVIMVEQVPRGDPARVFPALFEAVNRGKRSVALNLKQPEGLEAFYRLVATADVVLEGFRPGVAARLGVDYETLRGKRPGLIYCSISGYGQTGPERLTPGHNLSYEARAGAIRVENGHVAENTLPVADLSSAMFAAVAVLAALAERARAPHFSGRYIDVSMTEAVLSWNCTGIARAVSGEASSSGGLGREPAYGVFRTADGWITLSIAHEDHFWRALCDALDNEELRDLAGSVRRSRSEELRAWLASRLTERPTEAWLALFADVGVPAGPVNTLEDTLKDPLFRDRGIFSQVGETVYVRTPLRFDGRFPEIDRPAPAVGEDTRRYLEDVGFSADAIEAMVTRGIAAVARR